MSEVIRWKLKGFLPGVEGMCKAVMRPEVVLSSDYDASQVELAALREENERLKAESFEGLYNEAIGERDALREELAHSECMRQNYKIDAGIYKDALTAAEQRNSTIAELLDSISKCYAATLSLYTLEKIAAALAKPTESGASE